MAYHEGDLPDMTPVHIDFNIKEFKSRLCCRINPVAIVYKKIACQDCFERLRAIYSRDSWDLGGGTTNE